MSASVSLGAMAMTGPAGERGGEGGREGGEEEEEGKNSYAIHMYYSEM